MDLIQKLQAETHMSITLITRDLGVVAEIRDQVAVYTHEALIPQRASVVQDHVPNTANLPKKKKINK